MFLSKVDLALILYLKNKFMKIRNSGGTGLNMNSLSKKF